MLHHLTHITAIVNDDEVAKSPAISDDDAARKRKRKKKGLRETEEKKNHPSLSHRPAYLLH